MTSLGRCSLITAGGADFPGSEAGPGGAMEELSGVLKGAGRELAERRPPPAEADRPGQGRAGAGLGWPGAGPAASPTFIGYWRADVIQAGALLPTQWNWSRGGAENADLASSTDIHSLFLSDTHSSPHSHLCQRAGPPDSRASPPARCWRIHIDLLLCKPLISLFLYTKISLKTNTQTIDIYMYKIGTFPLSSLLRQPARLLEPLFTPKKR